MQKRYPIEETDLFYSFSSVKEQEEDETPEFPWWKPVWENDCWNFKNSQGKYMEMRLLTMGENIFPDFVKHFAEARTYKLSSVFFVVWAQKIAYYKSVWVWNYLEGDFKKMYPEKNSKQIDRLCDEGVAKFFENLKSGEGVYDV